jgi:hypothetical protein
LKLRIRRTNQFKKDLKRMLKRGKEIEDLLFVVRILIYSPDWKNNSGSCGDCFRSLADGLHLFEIFPYYRLVKLNRQRLGNGGYAHNSEWITAVLPPPWPSPEGRGKRRGVFYDKGTKGRKEPRLFVGGGRFTLSRAENGILRLGNLKIMCWR